MYRYIGVYWCIKRERERKERIADRCVLRQTRRTFRTISAIGYRSRLFFGRRKRRLRRTEFRRLTHLPVETATVPESSCIFPPDSIHRMMERAFRVLLTQTRSSIV